MWTAILENLDNLIQQIVHATPLRCDSRYHRNPGKASEGIVIEMVFSFLKFIKHVQGHHHLDVHVDELSCEVEIAFEA